MQMSRTVAGSGIYMDIWRKRVGPLGWGPGRDNQMSSLGNDVIGDLFGAALKSEYFSHYNLAKILPFFAINQ
jgi:hypothetical protein